MPDPNLHTFNRQSRQYARYRPRYPRPFFDYLLSLLDKRHRLWDCACGNGQVAVDLADQFDEVHATDISPNQIAHAFPHPKIQYRVLPAEQPQFPDRYFDLICVAQALHWFDIPAFFREARRVLRPGGILAVFGYGFFRINAEIDALLADALHRKLSPFWSARNQLVISGYSGVDFPFDPVPCPDFAITAEWMPEDLINYISTWSAVKRYNQQASIPVEESLRRILSPVWPEPLTVYMDIYKFIRRK